MKSGRFLVTNADEDSAILRDAEQGQVHTLEANPGVEAGDVLDATVRAVPPMAVTYEVIEVDERRTIPVEHGDEPPTRQEQDIAAEQSVGELTRQERAGVGELHVLTVPEDGTEEAVADIRDDEATVERAARLDVNRVEIRSTAGVVSVRYLP